jgi:glyoxylase-like metal-dependent hydrolase (beta-lactamase superfamily II)
MAANPLAPRTERVADGVWRHSGDLRRAMNVFLIEDGGGVLAFDAGTEAMTKALARAAAELGGLTRVVLGHSHPDHRGTAPGLGVPVLCHPDEVEDARSDGGMHYFALDRIPIWYSRMLYPRLLRRWDGGPVEIADTISEGDRIGEFEIIHFPGHAPGLIGLWRERDRLAIVSDVIYLLDTIRLHGGAGRPVVPHPAFTKDVDGARESVRKLAALGPRTVMPGHEAPLVGEPDELRAELERAAAAPIDPPLRD